MACTGESQRRSWRHHLELPCDSRCRAALLLTIFEKLSSLYHLLYASLPWPLCRSVNPAPLSALLVCIYRWIGFMPTFSSTQKASVAAAPHPQRLQLQVQSASTCSCTHTQLLT